jgi:tetratricopeptide (TPR) repeat protein
VQPTEEDVALMGLSREILCVIVETPLFRHDLPGPGESPDLLRRYLQQGPYENLSGAEYRVVMEEAVRLWPQSRYAHAGLAHALLAGHGTQASPADKRWAADELLTAAEIAFSEGKVRYVMDLAPLLADLGDKAALDRYFQQVFESLPPGDTGPWYVSYLQYAQALATLGDERAETYFRKATEVSPKGVGDAYDSYARYLFEHHKAQAVLELLVPNSPVEQVMYQPAFHHLRCQALEQVGRKAEAAEACQRARELTPRPGAWLLRSRAISAQGRIPASACGI